MDAILLFYIGWTAGYLHSCQQKGKPPSWLYGVGSFWFFSLVSGKILAGFRREIRVAG